MAITRCSYWSLLTLVLTASAAPAFAQQTVEEVGIRALGMAGAFVAVADDANAVAWNPAGLAFGRPLGMTIGWNRLQSGNRKAPPGPGALSQSANLTSLGSLPLGVFYGRRQTTLLMETTNGILTARHFDLREYGGTILQSLTQGVVVGTSLKYLRGTAASGLAAGGSAEEALDLGSDLDGKTSNSFDLDVGFMLDFEVARLGFMAQNLRQPEFRDLAGNTTRLTRRTRVGLSVLPTDGLTLAIDVDLDAVSVTGDLRRIAAFGGEVHVQERLWVRGGVRWNFRGDRLPVYTTGASYLIRRGMWLEGYSLVGTRNGERGFGFGMRAG